MTQSPCYKDGKDCNRRHVGCRAGCEDWRKWEVIHAEERAKIREQKLAENEINSFVADQSMRWRASYNRNNSQSKKG